MVNNPIVQTNGRIVVADCHNPPERRFCNLQSRIYNLHGKQTGSKSLFANFPTIGSD
uniref:Uncharacterized protein n=1 Tax=Arundo donax TaxID=35708 RepID=A0A0A9A2E2_ARUDO